MAVDNCKTCLYFLEIGGPIGVCRRFPTYQNRSPQEWCGEHSGMLVLPVKDMTPESVSLTVNTDEPVKRRGRPKKGENNVQASE